MSTVGLAALVVFFRQKDIRTFFFDIKVLFLLCKKFDLKDRFYECRRYSKKDFRFDLLC